MFIDKAVIFAKAGRGGDGKLAFLREKFMPNGGPSGGDGGHGGSVILVATHRVGTLVEISRAQHYRAESGEPGGKKNRTGRSAEDLTIEVPLGTLVREPYPEEGGRILADLTVEGQTFRAAKGGRGGRGNARFASSTNQAPTHFEPGTAGEEAKLVLELKLIADVGLVGMPNAGKSTLISRVSEARPKVAAYPFTTLSPVPGIVSLGDFQSCVIADLPGLIEGAHRGVGLGTEFLRHVERTRMLVHLVDAVPLDGKDPLEAYRQIREELRLYGAGLENKVELVAINKMDLPGAEETVERFRKALPDREILPISAVVGTGLRELLFAIKRKLAELGPAPYSIISSGA